MTTAWPTLLPPERWQLLFMQVRPEQPCRLKQPSAQAPSAWNFPAMSAPNIFCSRSLTGANDETQIRLTASTRFFEVSSEPSPHYKSTQL
jgi:hypothetical protein